jgi:hypothetical protein
MNATVTHMLFAALAFRAEKTGRRSGAVRRDATKDRPPLGVPHPGGAMRLDARP